MVCSGEGMGDAKPLIQCFHKLCSKLWALVRDNFDWNVMESKDLLIMYIRNALHIDVKGGQKNVHLFTVIVYTGSKNCSNVWLFWKDELTTNQKHSVK